MKVYAQIEKEPSRNEFGKIEVYPNELIGTFGLYLKANEEPSSSLGMCNRCALKDSGLCTDFACRLFERSDSKNVFFTIARITTL